MGEMNQPRERLHALTSLRFFAAVFVVFFHFIWEYFPAVTHQSLLGKLVDMGHCSVSFFFLLSGYILAFVYLRRGDTMRVRAFFLARFARVYPLFLATLILDTPILLMARLSKYGLKSALLKTGITFAGNTVMLQAWVPWLRGINDPCWSLSAETLFYLSFPWIGIALWKLRGAQLWFTAAILYVGGQLLVLLLRPHLPGDEASYLPLLHLSTFGLGILLARWQTLKQTPGVSSRRPFIAASLVTVLSLGCFVVITLGGAGIPFSSKNDGLLAPIFMGIIWAFSHSQWLPARVLGARWLVVLGEASFGLYLLQFPVFHFFELFHLPTWSIVFPLYLGVTISLSVLSFLYFETPIRRRILKFGHGPVRETTEMASDAQ
jgi:peptidoglycan/LPS O-acetylase OafA/YrhL